MDIYDYIKQASVEKNVSIAEVERQLGIGKNSLCMWGKKMPNLTSLLKIANYFNKPLDFFIGREISQPNTTIDNNINAGGNNYNITTDKNSTSFFCEPTTNLGEIEKELITVCAKLTIKNKTTLLSYAYELENK